jgi:hypothetical protein
VVYQGEKIMPVFEVTSPDGKTYEVTAPAGASQAEVLAYAKQQFQSQPEPETIAAPPVNVKPERTASEQVGRGASMLARGLAAPTVGAIGGGMVAGPVGALAGSLAVPAGDLLTAGYNALAPKQYQSQYPSTAIQNLLTKAGMPEPESMLERGLVSGGGALGGVGGQIGALGKLATTAQTQTGRNIAEQLSQAPSRQLAASVPAGTASQVVGESTDSPILGMLAGGLASAPFAAGATSRLTQKPSVNDLKAQASEQYDIAKLSGFQFKNNAFKKNAIDIQTTLKQEGFDKDLHPNINAAINRLVKDGTPKTLQNVETLRKVAKAPAASINADERRLAQVMIEKLDDFVENAQPNQIMAGKNTNANSVLKDARKFYSQAKKGEILDDIFNSAELRSEANYSQSGMENALRRKLVNLADNKKLMRTFTKEEQADIIKTAKGGPIQNTLRWAGKLSPSSVIAGAGGSYLGASLLGPAGAVIAPMVGAASKYGATQLGLKNFEDLQRRLLTGGEYTSPEISPAGAVIGRGLLGDFQPK